eukprot:Anaeramoba_flamelloidesa809625_20.p1 GENE.a809625_20~~a809625_20.p1  ORF type:complete len:149 (+),score=44.23 a809625_20:177-623(+)
MSSYLYSDSPSNSILFQSNERVSNRNPNFLDTIPNTFLNGYDENGLPIYKLTELVTCTSLSKQLIGNKRRLLSLHKKIKLREKRNLKERSQTQTNTKEDEEYLFLKDRINSSQQSKSNSTVGEINDKTFSHAKKNKKKKRKKKQKKKN